MEHIRGMFPPGGPVAILKQLRLRFGGAFSAVCGGGVRTTGPSRRQRQCMVSDGSERGRLSLTWNSCRFAGNLWFPRTAMAQWQNSLNFQSFLHRSCLRVECHVVSVSFVSLRNCGACPLVAPANHDSGHRAIRCCIFEDGDDVDRKEVKEKAAFSF